MAEEPIIMLRGTQPVTLRDENQEYHNANNPVPISIQSPLESNGAMPVNIQDQHSRMLDLKFINADPANFTTLSADVSQGDYIIPVTATTGMSVGSILGLTNPNGTFYFGDITAINALNVTLDTQLDNDFPSADSNVFPGSTSMNVLGTMADPVSFFIGRVGVGTGIDIDITRIMGNMTDNAVMTDELFGSLTALTNGMVLRHVNGTTQNLWNLKTNGAIALLCFDAVYPDKLPTGIYAFRFRNTFAGQSKHGVTIRLEAGDTLELLIQDDLTGLIDFQMMAQGHLVTD
jgi:hypothetical protein